VKRTLLVGAVVPLLLTPLLFTAVPSSAESRPDHAKGLLLRLNRKAPNDLRATFDLTGLDPADLERLSKANLEPEQWQALFPVTVAASDPAADRSQPAMLGTYRIEKDTLRFEPRFPLTAGVRYRAVFHPSRIPGRTREAEPVVTVFEIPKPQQQATTVVARVYPTASKLPENQLKFYIHFSAPMSRGEAYQHIRLLDSAGKTIEAAFLELGEELWDPDGMRFTLLIDPGRIKRGLRPREELGPVLQEGKSYTLVIDPGWKDAQGNPLKAEHRKAFQTGPEQDKAIDPKVWTIVQPPAGSPTALEVRFPRPLDHALLHRMLWVTDAQGRKVPGTIKVAAEETRWHFTPDRPWNAGAYQLVADTTLEDLAGNTITGPFEVDVLRPIQRKIETITVQLPFVCK
jgi:hypothetical protein